MSEDIDYALAMTKALNSMSRRALAGVSKSVDSATIEEMKQVILDTANAVAEFGADEKGGRAFAFRGSGDVPSFAVKRGEDGKIAYIRIEDTYVYGKYGWKNYSYVGFLVVLRALQEVLHRLVANIEEYAERYEYSKRFIKNVKDYSSEELRRNLDNIASDMASWLVKNFGTGEERGYYSRGELEIKMEKGYVKYVRLKGNYIVSQYGYGRLEDYMQLLKVLSDAMEKEISYSEKVRDELGDMVKSWEELKARELEITQVRKVLKERIYELAMKIAIWDGTGSNENYVYDGQANGHNIKIRVEKGELKYVAIDGGYVVSQFDKGVSLKSLKTAHDVLYEKLMENFREVEEIQRDEKVIRPIPTEVKKKLEVTGLSGDSVAVVEEERILLPQEIKKGDTITRRVVQWNDGRKEVWEDWRMKEVTVRKPHRCEVCGRTISAGERALVITEKTKRGRRFSEYYCSNEYSISEERIRVSKDKEIGVEVEL